MKELIEFYCSECSHYTYVKIRLDLDGNHIMRCPNCGHLHYRVVTEGKITDQRFNEYKQVAAVIYPVKSAAVPASERKTMGDIGRQRELEASGFCK
jgi:NAD-dependent SIR2 family protein deacetylase